jgi:hypothetical protein
MGYSVWLRSSCELSYGRIKIVRGSTEGGDARFRVEQEYTLDQLSHYYVQGCV